MGARWRGERGQSTVEWVGLVLAAALVLGALAASVGARVPGGSLARAIAERIICAARLSGACPSRVAPELERAYGQETAMLVREHAPRLRYERGMTALPVDYRRCREEACSHGAGSGSVWRSSAGEPVVAFVHVIDCREGAPARNRPRAADCSGPRQGNLYLQYWFYYAGSATAEGRIAPGAVRRVSSALGAPSFHRDDWESYLLRIGPRGTEARASSHHGYVHDIDGGWRPRLGRRPDGSLAVRRPAPRKGWGPATGTLYVSGGSHAGNARAIRHIARRTPRERLGLIPLAPIVAPGPAERFAVTPPWSKRVWRDPEYEGTD